MHLWIEVTVLRQFCTVCAQMQKAVYFFAMPSLCSRMLLGIHFRNCFLHLIILMRSLIVTLDDSGFDVLSCKNCNDNHITQKNSHWNKINELPNKGFVIEIESWGDFLARFLNTLEDTLKDPVESYNALWTYVNHEWRQFSWYGGLVSRENTMLPRLLKATQFSVWNGSIKGE